MISVNKSVTSEQQNNSLEFNGLGWSPFFQKQLKDKDASLVPARVIGVRKNSFWVSRGEEELLVTLAGKILNDQNALYPAVGDWVLLRDSLIFSILSRKNVLARKASGGRGSKNDESSHQDQLIAVNLDKVFIVCGLDRDFNLRRIERYLTMVYNCGIMPEIVLTKADLHQDPYSYVDEVESVAFGVPIYLVSAEDEKNITEINNSLLTGETAAIVGSSGAGKSTLINRLYGEEIRATGSVSSTLGKGKHTTTTRDLIVLPSGGMLIDNPGIREVALGALAGGSDNSVSAFPEIEELSHTCRFQDCTHTHEPGCEIQNAVAKGEIDPERLKSYHKIQSELKYCSERERKSAARIEREQWKGVSQKIKAINKAKKR